MLQLDPFEPSIAHFFNDSLTTPECEPPYRPLFEAKSSSSFGKSKSSTMSETLSEFDATLKRLRANGEACYYSVIEGDDGTRTSRGQRIVFNPLEEVHVNASFVEIVCGHGESEFVTIPYRAANIVKEKEEIKRRIKLSGRKDKARSRDDFLTDIA